MVTGRHPVTAAPGTAEQTVVGAASVGGHVQAVGRWRRRRRSASRGGWDDGDGRGNLRFLSIRSARLL